MKKWYIATGNLLTMLILLIFYISISGYLLLSDTGTFINPGGNINISLLLEYVIWIIITISIPSVIWYYRIEINPEKQTIRLGGKNKDIKLIENLKIPHSLTWETEMGYTPINSSKWAARLINVHHKDIPRSGWGDTKICFEIEGKKYLLHSDEYGLSGIYYISKDLNNIISNKQESQLDDKDTIPKYVNNPIVKAFWYLILGFMTLQTLNVIYNNIIKPFIKKILENF